MVISVASGKVILLCLRVTENGMPGGQFTVAVCLSNKVEQEGRTCIETDSVPCAEVAFAGTESASNSVAYAHKGWGLNPEWLRVGVTRNCSVACAMESRGNGM
jgi:hypothetical protein